MSRPANMKPYLALLVVYFVWGTTVGAIRIGTEGFPPALLVCIRFLVAGGLLLAIALFRREGIPSWVDIRRNALIGFLLFFCGNGFVSWSVQHIPTGVAATLVAFTPFWMIGLSALLPPREKVEPLALLGLLVGFGGMLVLLSPQLTHAGEISLLYWLSVIATLAMSFCWSCGAILARRSTLKTSVIMGLAIQNLWAGLLLIPVALLTVPTWHFQPSNASLMALAYLIFFGTLLTTPCYLYTLKTLPVAVSSTFAYVNPLIALVFGWLFLREGMTLTTVLGVGVILTGVFLVQVAGIQKARLRVLPVATPSQTSTGA